MRRLLLTATLLVFVSLVSLWGQMRGGGNLAGGRPVSVGHPAVAPRAPRITVPHVVPRVDTARRFGHGFLPRVGQPFFHGRLHLPFRDFDADDFVNDFDADDFVNDFDADDFIPFSFPAWGFATWYGYPFYSGYSMFSAPSYTGNEEYQNQLSTAQQQAYRNQQQIVDRLDRLQSRVDRLLEVQQGLGASASPPPPKAEPRYETSTPALLVFQDKHTEEAQNYAIVGQTLWVFTEHHSRKIPLADLDLAETEKENAARGIEFHIPAAR